MVTRNTFTDDFHRGIRSLHLVNGSLLVLKRLINAEEMPHFLKNMRRQLRDIRIDVVIRVVKRNGDDLFVVSAVVDHRDNADGIAFHKGHRLDGLRTKNQHVKRIAVIAVGSRDKTIIGGIMRGSIQNPVKAQKPAFLVKLVFFLRTLRDFNHAHKIFRPDPVLAHIVPDVSHILTAFLMFIGYFTTAFRLCKDSSPKTAAHANKTATLCSILNISPKGARPP